MEHLDLAGILTTPPQWNMAAVFDQQDAIYLSNSRQMLEPIMEETSEDEEHALNSLNQQQVECDVSSSKTERISFWSSNESETGSVIRIEVTKDADSISERDYLCPAKRAKRCDELSHSRSLEDDVVLRRPLYGETKNNSLERFLSYDGCARDSWGGHNNRDQRNSTGSRRFDEFNSDSDSLSFNSLSRSSSLIQFESLERQLMLQEQHTSMNSLGNSSPSLFNFEAQNNDDLNNKTNSNSGCNSRRGSQSSLLKRYESTDGRLHQTYYDLDKLNFDEINGSSGGNSCGVVVGVSSCSMTQHYDYPLKSSHTHKYSLIMPDLRSDSESSTASSESSSTIGKVTTPPPLVNDNEIKVKTLPTSINSHQRRGSKNSAENLSEDSGYGEPTQNQHWFNLRRSKSQNFIKSTEQFYMEDINGERVEEEEEEEENDDDDEEIKHSKADECNRKHFCTNIKIAATATNATATEVTVATTTATETPLITTTRSVTEKYVFTNDRNNETETFIELRANGNEVSTTATNTTTTAADAAATAAALTRLFKNSRLQPSDFHLAEDDMDEVEELSNEDDEESVLRQRQRSQTHSPSPVSSEASSANTKNSSSPSSCTSATTCASAASFTWLMSPQSHTYNHHQHHHHFDHEHKQQEHNKHSTTFLRPNSLPDIRDQYTTTIIEETLPNHFHSYHRHSNKNKTESVNVISTKTSDVNKCKNIDYMYRENVKEAQVPEHYLAFDVETSLESLRKFRAIRSNNKKLPTGRVMLKETNWMWWGRNRGCSNSLPEALNNWDNKQNKPLDKSKEDFDKIKRCYSWSCLENLYLNKEGGFGANETGKAISGAALGYINASYYNLSDLEELSQRRNKMAERFNTHNNLIKENCFNSNDERSVDKLDGIEDAVIVEETQQLLRNEGEDVAAQEAKECVQHVQLILRKPTTRQSQAEETHQKTLSLTQDFERMHFVAAPPPKTFDQDPTNLKTSYAQSLEKCNFDPSELSTYQETKSQRNLHKRRFHTQVSYDKKKNLVSSTPNLNAYQGNGDQIEDDLYVSSAHTSMHQLPQGGGGGGVGGVIGKPLGILLPVGTRNSNKEVSFCPVVSKYSWQEQSSEECTDPPVVSTKNNIDDSDDELLDNADATVIFNTKENENIAKRFKEMEEMRNAIKKEQQEQPKQQQQKQHYIKNNEIPLNGLELQSQRDHIINTENQEKIDNNLEENKNLLKEHDNNNKELKHDRENERIIQLTNENEHENEMEVKQVLITPTTTTSTSISSSSSSIIVDTDNSKATTVSQAQNVNNDGSLKITRETTDRTPEGNNKNSNKIINKQIEEEEGNVVKKPTIIVARPLSIQLPMLSEPPTNRAHQILYASQQMLNNLEKNREKLLDNTTKANITHNNNNNNKIKSNIGRMENKGTSVATTAGLAAGSGPHSSHNSFNNNNELMKSKFKADEKHPNSKSFLARFANGFRFSLRRNKKKLQQQQLQQQQQQQQPLSQTDNKAQISTNSASNVTSTNRNKSNFIYIPLKGPLPYKNNNGQLKGNEMNGNDMIKHQKIGGKSSQTGGKLVVEQKVTGKPPIPGKQYQQYHSAQSKPTKLPPAPLPPPQPTTTTRTSIKQTADAIQVGASRFYTTYDNLQLHTNINANIENEQQQQQQQRQQFTLNREFLDSERSYYSHNKQFTTLVSQKITDELLPTCTGVVSERNAIENSLNHVNNNNMNGFNNENALLPSATGVDGGEFTSPSRASVLQKTQMFNDLAAAAQAQSSTISYQNKNHQQQQQQEQQSQNIVDITPPPKIGLIETNLDTHETVITGKTRSLINIGTQQRFSVAPQREQLELELEQEQLNEITPYRRTYGNIVRGSNGDSDGAGYQSVKDKNIIIHQHYNNEVDDDDEVVVQPDGTVIVVKSGSGVNKNVGGITIHHQIASVRRPHKSMEFLLDKENQKIILQINVSQAKARISGGFTDSNYNLNLAKYVVSIRHSSAAEKYYFGAGHHCGGSILTTYFILTAAHCLEGRSENNYHVVIGTPRLFDRTFNTQISYVKKFIIHEYFNRYPIVNDIGLVELQNPIFIDYKTADVIGITDEPLPINGIYYAAGWGFVYENGPTPNEILYATTYLLLGNNKCNNDLYKIYGPWHPMLFCAGNLIDPEIQTYFGDSGGPLFYNSRVVGIVSYMTNLRVDGMSVFTNVSNYIPWIRRYVWFDLKPYGETTARRNIYEMKRRNERKSCGIVKNDKKSKIFYISFLILYMTLSHLSEIN